MQIELYVLSNRLYMLLLKKAKILAYTSLCQPLLVTLEYATLIMLPYGTRMKIINHIKT